MAATGLSATIALIDRTVAGIATTDEIHFGTDRLLIDATAFRVMHIGEAVSKLPVAVKGRHALPWQRIVGMRNRLAHEYTRINAALLWRTVHDHLDDLRAACLAEIANDKNQGE